MGSTKEVSFAAKIPTLQEACQRIMNNSFPQPSPEEISTNLRHFTQTLLSVLKDVPSIPYDKICNPIKDKERISLFPNLDYRTLFVTLVQLLELLPQIQLQASIQTIGQALLQTLSCLVPFLEHDYIDTLPYLISSSIAVLPNSLHKDLIDFLCYNLLPICVINNRILQNNENPIEDNYTNVSIPSILMNVFFFTEPPAFNSRLLETLMQFRSNILKDLFCVIAYGTVKAKCAAVELLFQYYPQLNPSSQDRKQLADKHSHWVPVTCQYDKCSSKLNNEAVKMCIDYNLAINSSTNKGPVMLICIECADALYKGRSRDTLIDMLLPMENISYNCENKACRSPISQKMAISTCFSIECANYNCSKPVRYCNLCNQQKHGPNSNHMVHTMIESAWKIDAETQCYFIEAIISLLKEAQPVTDKSSSSNSAANAKDSGVLSNNFGGIVNFQSLDSSGGGQPMNLGLNATTLGLPTDESQDTMALEERHLLSRYGIWLITQLCTPTEQTNDEVLGRLLAMLFQWFHYTACLPDDQAGSALERLKAECIQGWLMKVVKCGKFNIFANCLLPHPMDCSKVSGHWDCFPSTTNQIKEGFKRLICLVPYDIITFEVWSYIFPYWMECFRHEVPEEELAELKILLSKVLDPDLSPLGFKTSDMYKFITIRFEHTTSPVQEQTLYWIQILTLLEVPIPLKLLLDMFERGVTSLKSYTENPDYALSKGKDIIKGLILSPTKLSFKTMSKSSYFKQSMIGSENAARTEKMTNIKLEQEKDIYSEHDKELNLAYFILMLDILIKQMELQEVTNQKGIGKEDPISETILNLLINILSTAWAGKHTCEYKDFILNLNSSFLNNVANGNSQMDSTQCAFCELCSIWFQLALQLLEFFCPQHEVPMTEKSLDSKSFEIQPLDVKKMDSLSNNLRETSERQTRDLSSSSDLKETHNLKMNVIEEEDDDEGDETKDGSPNVKLDDYPGFETLPTSLKLLHLLLKSLESHKNSDVIYHIVYMIKKLCLHAEVLSKAAKDRLDYLSYAQDKLLIVNFYQLLQSEFSHIAELAVPLLLHSLLLPFGKEKFWNLIRKNFTDIRWNERFTAVERVTTIAHFLDINFIKNALSLQNSLANCFAYLVQCLDDIEAAVSQRTLLNLESIRTNSLKLMISCLELQFDTMILDRPIILQTIFQLYNHLSERRFLTWDFFLNRFDALFLEAQVVLEACGEIDCTRDLKNSNVHSEIYQKKLERAKIALNNAKNFNLSSQSSSSNTGDQLNGGSKLSSKRQQSDSGDQPDDRATLQPKPPALRRKASKMQSAAGQLPEKLQHFQNFQNVFSPTDNQFKQQMSGEELNQIKIVYLIFENGEQDPETMHTLVFLLSQFLSRPDQSQPNEEKSMGRTQQIVIKHLSILLGFSPSEKKFAVSPKELRKSPVFNSVITSLPKVLDFNHKMGNLLAPTLIVPLLIYAPSPLKFKNEFCHHPFNGKTNLFQAQSTSKMPFYSLFMLEPHVRKSWLMSVQILFYKYQYTAQPLHTQVHMIIQIIINTLESHFHLNCRPTADAGQQGASPARSRSHDLSNESIELENADKHAGADDMLLNRQLSDETSMSEEDENESQADNSKKSDTIKQATAVSKEDIQSSSSRKLSKLFGKEEPSSSFEKTTKIVSPKHKSLANRLNLESVSFRNKGQSEQATSSEKEKKKGKKKMAEMMESDAGIEMRTLADSLKHEDANFGSLAKTSSLDKLNTQTRASPIKTSTSSKSVLSVKPQQERLLPLGSQYVSNKIDSSVSIDFPLPITERLLPIGPSPKHQQLSKLKEFKKQDSTTESQDSLLDEQTPDQSGATTSAGRTKMTAIVRPKLKCVITPDSSNDTVNLEDKKLESDLPKSPLTITTSLPLEASAKATGIKTSVKQIGQEGSIDVNYDPTLSPIKSQKEKSLSESKVDKAEKFRFGEMKKQLNSIQTTTSGGTYGSSGTSVSIDIPEEDVLRDAHPEADNQIKSKALRHYKQKKARKQQADSGTVAGNVQRKNRKIDQQSAGTTTASTPGSSGSTNDLVSGATNDGARRQTNVPKQSKKALKNRIHDESRYEYCMNCNQILEEFSEHELDLCITILGTFLNREPAMAAPLLPLILSLMSKYAVRNPYSWQNEFNTHIHVPGNIRSVAKQLIRCILQNFSTNGIFQQLFSSYYTNNEVFRAITISLADYTELNIVSPLNILFKDLVERKHLLAMGEMILILTNVATYLECIPQPELSTHSGWGTLFPVLEAFFRKFSFYIPANRIYNLTSLIRIMLQTIRLPSCSSYKTILEIYSKMLSQVIQQSPLDYEYLLELTHLNCKTFAKERDRLLLTRTVVYELVNCIKMKNMIPDENVMILIQFLLQDGDGTLVPSMIIENISSYTETHISNFSTCAQECCKQYAHEFIEFIADVHSLSRIKNFILNTSVLQLTEEMLGAQIKAGISQYLAIEMTRREGQDHRAVTKYLPWLYSLPTVSIAKEFLDCVSHIRLLSWILLGSMQHCCMMKNHASKFHLTQPIPLEANGHIAENIQIILSEFPEQANLSVLHMTSLFHAFVLCQLWTMYCEMIAEQNQPGSEQYNWCTLTLCDFWSKVTPNILQLICSSKQNNYQHIAETVTLHFMRLLESLMECNSNLLTRLLPMWIQVFQTYPGQLTNQLQNRLENCINWAPPAPSKPQNIKKVTSINSIPMLKSLQELQIKMAKYEFQTSSVFQLFSKDAKRS